MFNKLFICSFALTSLLLSAVSASDETLDQAYDQGQTIKADQGTVNIQGSTDGLTTSLTLM